MGLPSTRSAESYNGPRHVGYLRMISLQIMRPFNDARGRRIIRRKGRKEPEH